LFHLHSTAIAAFGFRKPHVTKPVVSTIHSFYHPEYESTIRMKVLSHAFLPQYRAGLKMTKNIAISNQTRLEAIGQHVPVNAVIGNGIPFKDLAKVRGNKARASDVIFLGRFTEQKGIFEFIEAFKNSPYRIVLAGYGEPAMERRIVKLCQTGGITCALRPTRKEAMALIASSRVFAFPSKYEPFGIVGLEAMALGKPVVACKQAGGPRDFVEPGKNGVLVGRGAQELRKTVEALLKNEKKLGKMGSQAITTAKSYDWSEIAKKTKGFYVSLKD